MKPRIDECRSQFDALVEAALAGADPARCVREALHGRSTPASAVIAVGKAAPAMFDGFVDAAGAPMDRFMLVPKGLAAPSWAIRGDHPLPTASNVEAARGLVAFIERVKLRAGPGTRFVFLLSGGASALLTLPMEPIGLDEYRSLTERLLHAGADIHQLNCVRRHAEQLKGGRLAAMMAPAGVEALVLSDVIGDDLSVIGSGPVAPDPTSIRDALGVLDSFGIGAGVVRDVLEAGVREGSAETPKPGDTVFDRVSSRVVGNNALAVDAAASAAARLGFRVVEARSGVTGEASELGRVLACRLAQLPEGTPAVVVLGGETTVRVGDAHGRGGPCTELVLAGAIEIAGQSSVAIGAFATDGVDGPTDAAGAWATPTTCDAARSAGLDPAKSLIGHDSGSFFERVGGLIRIGPTGTNVNDVMIGLHY